MTTSPRSTRRDIAVVLVAGAVAFLVLYYPVFTRLHAAGIVDHDQFNSWQLAVNDALRHGSLLHWIPYMCGGQPGIGNPQSRALSPFIVLGLFLSPVVQQKVVLLVNAIVGLGGFVALAVWSGAAPWIGLVGFFIWAGNGHVATRVLNGAPHYYSQLVLPAVVALLYREALAPESRWARPRAVAAGAALFAFILYQDGFHVLIFASPLLLSLALGWSGRRRTAPIAWLGASATIAAGLSLPRLLPAFFFLSETSRVPPTNETVAPLVALRRTFDPDLLGQIREILSQPNKFPLGHMGHVGILSVGLFALFLAVTPARRGGPARWPWLLGAAIAASLTLGDLGPVAPWHYLRPLPLFRNIRAPYKFQASFALAIACGAQLYLGWMASRGRRALAVAALASVGVFASMAASLWPAFRQFQREFEPDYDVIDHTAPFRQERFDPGLMFTAVAHNVDIINCYEPTTRHSNVPPGVPLAALVNRSGTVTPRLEPNRIVIDYQAPTDDVLLVFQNWDAGWQDEATGEVVERHPVGFMQVPVRAGASRVVLAYHPIWFELGLAMSGTFAAGLTALILLRRRRAPRPVLPVG